MGPKTGSSKLKLGFRQTGTPLTHVPSRHTKNQTPVILTRYRNIASNRYSGKVKHHRILVNSQRSTEHSFSADMSRKQMNELQHPKQLRGWPAIGRQTELRLDILHRRAGIGTKNAVNRTNIETALHQPLL
jgi:hypothetical protein